MEIDYVRDRDHWVAYVNGRFFCSADTLTEAINEVINNETCWLD